MARLVGWLVGRMRGLIGAQDISTYEVIDGADNVIDGTDNVIDTF